MTKGTGYWMDYDATRRGAVILFGEDGKAYVLSEPSPDAAVNLTQSYLAKLNYKEIGMEGSLDLAEEIAQLGKRTSTIMFLRESLYRLAELANSGELDEESIELFKIAMDSALKLAESEFMQSEASLERAKARKLDKLKDLGLKDEQLTRIID